MNSKLSAATSSGPSESIAPAKSRKQQRFLFMKFGPAWVKKHHFDKVDRKAYTKKKR